MTPPDEQGGFRITVSAGKSRKTAGGLSIVDCGDNWKWLRSSPRKRGPRRRSAQCWIPAFAGMSGKKPLTFGPLGQNCSLRLSSLCHDGNCVPMETCMSDEVEVIEAKSAAELQKSGHF